jgi:hypothetical protein
MAKRRLLADQLRAAIEAADESRYAISKLSGVSQGQISRFMAGGILKLPAVEALAEALNLHLTPKTKDGRK